MPRYTRRLFSQAISGAIVSLPIVNSLLRGDEPPRPLIMAKICVQAHGITSNGQLVDSDVFCCDFDPSVRSCAQVYLDLDEKALEELKHKYDRLDSVWVTVPHSNNCPDIVADTETEESFLKKTGMHSCLKPRWKAVVFCKQCDGGHRAGIGTGLTKAGARIKAQRALEKKLCLAKTECETKKQVIVSPVNRTNACCD